MKWLSICSGACWVNCHWYNACTAAWRALWRLPFFTASPLHAQLLKQIHHLDDGERRVGTLVAGLGAGTFDRLLDRVHGEHAEPDRKVVLHADLGHATAALAGDVFKVRRLATDDTAKRNERVVFLALGHGLEHQRHLERALYAHDFNIRGVGTVARERVERAFEQTFADETVEARDDDAKTRPAGAQVAVNILHVGHAVAFLLGLCPVSSI